MDLNSNKIENDIVKDSGSNQHESIRCRIKVLIYDLVKQHLWLFPLITGFLVILLNVSIYTSAMLREDVHPILPYLSDAGSVLPQAPYFSQLIDSIAILSLISALVVYKMSKHCIQVMLPESKEGKLKDLEPIQKSLNEINFRSLLFALIAAISLIIVGNFRSTESMNIHTTLAVLTFTMIYVYSLHICYILYQLSAYSNVCQSKPISLAIFILIGSLGAINSGIGVLINLFQVGEKLFDPEFRLKWNDSQEGYFWHVFSTANEWVAIIFMSLIFLCASKRIYLYNKHWNRII